MPLPNAQDMGGQWKSRLASQGEKDKNWTEKSLIMKILHYWYYPRDSSVQHYL